LFVCAAAAYVTYYLNLWGPIIKMADAASRQALEEGKKRLREFLEASDTGRQAIAMSAGASSSNRGHREEYEMSSMSGGKNDVNAKLNDEDNDIDDL
jgi:hypothetical protein